MPQVVLRRKDEIGDMGRHAVEVISRKTRIQYPRIIQICIYNPLSVFIPYGGNMEIQKSLAGIARETIDVYGIAYPGEIRMEDERFYMGDADLTGDCALADRIR